MTDTADHQPAFISGYIAALAWLAISDTGHDDGIDPDDLPDDIIAEATADAVDFYTNNSTLIADTIAAHAPADNTADFVASLGEDFALTRNRHGTGYWDRGFGTHGQQLTDAAHPYGDSAVHIADDGTVTLLG